MISLIAGLYAILGILLYLIFRPGVSYFLYYSGIAFLIESFMSKPDQYLILIYHKVSDEAGKYSVSPQIFEDQMKFLKKKFKILRLDDISNIWNLTGKKIIITFDDGYDDNYHNAFRIAKKFSLPIHIFLITSRINGKEYLTWKQIKDMQTSGLVVFGNHSRNHLILSDLDTKRVKHEIVKASTDLEKKLGKVKYFSYPFGDRFDSKTTRILKEAKFQYALTWIPGINDRYSDNFQLKRISINDLSVQTRFKLKYPNLFFKLKRNNESNGYHQILE